MSTFTEPTITCPKCHNPIKLTESLAAPLVESARKDYEQRLAQKDADILARENAVKTRQAQLEQEKQSVDQAVALKLNQQRAQIAAEESRKAKELLGADLKEKSDQLLQLSAVLKQREDKLAETQKAQAQLIEAQHKLEEDKREMELTIQKRIQDSKEAIRTQALKEAQDQANLKLFEKNQELQQAQQKLTQAAQREQSLSQQFQSQLKEEREKIAAEESRKAKQLLGTDLKEKSDQLTELTAILKQREEKLAEAQKSQADLLRQQRDLETKAREMELTIQTRINQELSRTKDEARKEAQDQLGLKLTEKETLIESLSKKIEELSRKAEQGSQQLQGEALELQLEALLASKFPYDKLEPVPKGEHGGDVLHRITHPTGTLCGTILWESKRTKAWSNLWLAKLRDDQRAAKADIAIIVSTALPESITSFDLVEGVWVTSPKMFLPVALCLRQSILDLAAARSASQGQQTKMDMVYQYLTGPGFKRRVEAIAEAFSTMKEDLENERKVITKQWAKREKQLERVMIATSGMYGDLQGIAGKSLPEVQGLDLKLLDTEPPSNDAQ
jgi:hypothetical protein